MTEPRIISRPVAGDADFWRVREFLQATVPVSPFGHNWDVRRWDGSYFYNPNGRWEDGWETGALASGRPARAKSSRPRMAMAAARPRSRSILPTGSSKGKCSTGQR